MTDEATNLVLEQLKRIHEEQRATRNEMRRMAENQMIAARSLESVRNSIGGLRDDLELMIRSHLCEGSRSHLPVRQANSRQD
jgi:hypothetical protein